MVSRALITSLSYVIVFGLAAAGCLVALRRAWMIDDPGTRWGLAGLFAGSGGWALLILAFLLTSTPIIARFFYIFSLIVGLTTIGAWLYFCSAYTGRTFHKTSAYRRAALGVYLAIVSVKITNPIHGLYFTTNFVTAPFPHLTVQHGLFQWLVAGLSYTLAGIGFFMLYELFVEADYDTRSLGLLAGVTILPVILDIVGFATPVLIDISYEPLGVAVFAVGVLYVFNDRFVAVQLTDSVDEAVIHVDDNGTIREFNTQAVGIFPSLVDQRGSALEAALPDVAALVRNTPSETNEGEHESESRILERWEDGEARYYLISESSFTLGAATLGRLIVVSDVTEVERRRRELDRHNDQLERFAIGIRHELRNSLQIIDGHIDIAGDDLERGALQDAREDLRTASQHTDRMRQLVGQFSDIAQYGQTPTDMNAVAVDEIAREAFQRVAPEELELVVECSTPIYADPSRLQQLFEYAFEFATYNDATAVSVRLTNDEFTITDDGRPVGDADPDSYFEHGGAVPEAEAGMVLPNLRLLARAQGWETAIDAEFARGIRIRMSGWAVAPANEPSRSRSR